MTVISQINLYIEYLIPRKIIIRKSNTNVVWGYTRSGSLDQLLRRVDGIPGPILLWNRYMAKLGGIPKKVRHRRRMREHRRRKRSLKKLDGKSPFGPLWVLQCAGRL